jgi:outer membrane immunogenic protein
VRRVIPNKQIGRSVIFGIALSALTTVAVAQESSGAPKYGLTRHDWDGFYAGLQAGYNWGYTDSATTWGAMGGPTETFAYGTNGLIGGLHVGYNHQIEDFVIGIEADFEAAGRDGYGIGSNGAVHSTDIDWNGSLRGRIGFVANQSTLFYVTGGLAYAHVITKQALATAVVPYTQSDNDWRVGWTIGGGIEHALSRKLSLRLGYTYTDLGRASYNDPNWVMKETTRLTSHSVRAGASFKF